MSKAIAVFVSLFIILSSSLIFAQDVLPERYHTYQEVFDTLTIIRDTYPEVFYLDTLGYTTRDSIPMLRLKISDNPSVDEDEPAVFYCGGVHADEVLSVEVAINFVKDFAERYERNDPIVLNFIEELEIFVIPFINPEGHIVVEEGDLYWRKNKSDNDTNGVFDDYDGVDNNRNYDFGWNIDDSDDPTSLMFKGYAPFTEFENIAMAAFAWQYRPLIALDYHSPTYGRPNVAYYPWYWYSNVGGHGMAPDESLMNSICQSFTNLILAIPDDSSTVHYTARRALVNKGDFKTYFYGNFGTAAFSVEISNTTIQDSALVDSIVAAHLPGQYYLLERTLGSGITGIIRDSVTLEPIEAEVQVTQHINDDINPRLSRPDFGRYRRLLASGSYTLRFLKDGYRTKMIYGVSVGSNGPTTTDVLLYPYNPRPPAPELVFPVMGDTLDDNPFTFTWSEPIYASQYLLEVSSDSTFETYVILDSNITEPEYSLPEPILDGLYFWRVRAANNNGWGPYSETYNFVMFDQTSIFAEDKLPRNLRLYQNHPNPFNASTQIRFEIPGQSRVVIEIYNISGALVDRPLDNVLTAGEHTLNWNGTDLNGNSLASGFYFYKLKYESSQFVRKMVLLK